MLRILDIVAHWPNRLWFQVLVSKCIIFISKPTYETISITVGALHSTSQIYGLFSWLSDFVGMFNLEAPNDEESIEKVIKDILYLLSLNFGKYTFLIMFLRSSSASSWMDTEPGV